MCLIIHGLGRDILDDGHVLANGFLANDHGWGVMFAEGGRIRTFRGFKFTTLAARIEEFADRELFVHMRYATHGGVALRNNHPFLMCGGEYALMHNGVIPIDCHNKKYSDTWHYARKLEQRLLGDPGAFGCGRREIEWSKEVSWSKLVLLRSDGEAMFVNRDLGTEYRGMWLSNDYSIPYSPKKKAASFGSFAAWEDDEADDDPYGLDEPYWDADLRAWVKWDSSAQDWVECEAPEDEPAYADDPDARLDAYMGGWGEDDFRLYG